MRDFDEKKEQVKELTDIVAVVGQHVTLKKSGRNWLGLCPFHSEKTGSFTVNPEKRIFRCFGCGEGGDVIKFLMNIEGQDFMAILHRLAAACGVELPNQKEEDDTATTPRRRSAKKETFTPTDTRTPVEKWQARAEKLVALSHENLLENKDQLAWLAKRGITLETVKHFRLGWNPEKLYRPRPAWGLPEEYWENSEKPKKLLIPAGLIVPCISGETIHRVIIRQKDPRNPKQKYMNITGCGNPPLVIPCRSGGSRPWVIVETYLDAMLVWQEAGDTVGVMALGAATSKPEAESFALLKEAPFILNCLDFDKAGAIAWGWWTTNFPHTAERWPVPEGKDPGEYVEEFGGNVRAWIMAGLPESLRRESDPPPPEVTMADPGTSSPDSAMLQARPPGFKTYITGCGKEIDVTEDPTTYRQLEGEGRLVFSKGEIERVELAKEDGEAVGDPTVADLMLTIKDVFRDESHGSYVKKRIEL